MMESKPTIVLFLNDWPVRPLGANSGGGEVATLSIARAMAKLGHRVVTVGNLPEGDCEAWGVTFWDFGPDYSLHRIIPRLSEIGPYYCFVATLIHPLLLLRQDPNCLARIVINHAPSVVSSGLEPDTVMKLVDCMICVSEAQRSLMFSRGHVPPEKVVVVKNAFDPDLFTYAGPTGRDWNKLIFTGRLEPAKGIHILLDAFKILKSKFSSLTLDVYGDESYWPDLANKRRELERTIPGLSFKGKVPQIEIAQALHRAGTLIFPSCSFESAGLAVVDAQASGCPVVASAVGGVPEYLQYPSCGTLVERISVESLVQAIDHLQSHQDLLVQMSNNCERLARRYTWQNAAEQMIKLAKKFSSFDKQTEREALKLNPTLQRTLNPSGTDYKLLMKDHESIAEGCVISDDNIRQILEEDPSHSAALLWQGLRCEFLGQKEEAKRHYFMSSRNSSGKDWQALFRLILCFSEGPEVKQAGMFASELLEQFPDFPLRNNLEVLVSLTQVEGAR